MQTTDMRPILGARVLLLLLGIGLVACGHDRIHEGDHMVSFNRVFGESPPPHVDVVNSIVVEYRWRLGVVSTDDWEFEIVAPSTWIEQKKKAMDLGPVGDDSFAARDVSNRKTHAARSWYAPQPLEAYDAFYLTTTSIPYVHMLVEKQPQPDGRYRLFMSKH